MVERYMVADVSAKVVLSITGKLVDAVAKHTPRLFKTADEAEAERELMQERAGDVWSFSVVPVSMVGYPLQGGSPEGLRCRLKVDGDRVVVGAGVAADGVLAIAMHDSEPSEARVYTHDEWNDLPCQMFVSLGECEKSAVTVGVTEDGDIIPFKRGG